MYCRIFSNIPDLYPLDTSSTLTPAVTTNNVSRHCQMSTGQEMGRKITPNRETLLGSFLKGGKAKNYIS